ncbi:RAS oncogene family member Rab27 isoform X2 [Brevipalpus obovatus]|uniref:RAS oncogene family member Rab27 isoform X2 n=1 Tax=Brevipalpus obovatus TaxID=246614 RepID=UPI003D9E6118
MVHLMVYKPPHIDGISRRSQRIHLQLWDTAGQERFRSLTTAFFRDAMGFILIFDVTSEQSFLNIRGWLDQLKTHAYCEDPDVVICGNKVDKCDERVVSEERAKLEASKYGFPYLETSAASGQNVAKTIETLLDLVMIRMHKIIENSAFLRNKSLDLHNSHLKLDSSDWNGLETKKKSQCGC